MKKILVINGPNLNLLGTREKEVYGSFTLEQIQNHTQEKLKRENVSLDWFQSNLEGEIIDRLHKSLKQNYLGIVINPAGYSHTSVAILDALKIIIIPIVEVHLSNVYRREEFRQTMLTAQAASMIMGGLGIEAYYMGVLALLNNEEK